MEWHDAGNNMANSKLSVKEADIERSEDLR